MTSEKRHYLDLGCASDWLKICIIQSEALPRFGKVTRYQYGISALASQMSFRWETTGGVAKCRLFSLARVFIEVRCYSSYYSRLKALPFHPQNWPKSFCKTISTVLMYCQRGVIWMDTPSTDSKVRTTSYSTINSTTGKYCSEAFIWMVTLQDIILRRKI